MQHIVDTALPLLLRVFDTDVDREAIIAENAHNGLACA